jgi:hypothetical protein
MRGAHTSSPISSQIPVRVRVSEPIWTPQKSQDLLQSYHEIFPINTPRLPLVYPFETLESNRRQAAGLLAGVQPRPSPLEIRSSSNSRFRSALAFPFHSIVFSYQYLSSLTRFPHLQRTRVAEIHRRSSSPSSFKEKERRSKKHDLARAPPTATPSRRKEHTGGRQSFPLTHAASLGGKERCLNIVEPFLVGTVVRCPSLYASFSSFIWKHLATG